MSDSENTNPIAACTWQGQAEALTRREPTKAIVTAFSAGLVLSLLPKRALLRVLAGVAIAVARPALCCFGVQKLWEFCPCKKEPKL